MMWWMLLTTAVAVEHQATPEEHVDIEAFCGSVVVVGQDRETVDVVGEGFELHTRPGRTRLRPGDGRNRLGRSCLDLTIRVPKGSHVEVEGVALTVRASGLVGRVELESVSGDLLLENGAATQVEAHSVSGSIRLHVGDNADVEANSVSGNIIVTGGSLQQLDLNSVSGNLSISAPPSATASVDGSTHNGNLSIVLDRAPQRLVANTATGRIRNGWSSQRPSRGLVQSELTLEGESGPSVRLHTFTGNISIDKKETP